MRTTGSLFLHTAYRTSTRRNSTFCLNHLHSTSQHTETESYFHQRLHAFITFFPSLLIVSAVFIKINQLILILTVRNQASPILAIQLPGIRWWKHMPRHLLAEAETEAETEAEQITALPTTACYSSALLFAIVRCFLWLRFPRIPAWMSVCRLWLVGI